MRKRLALTLVASALGLGASARCQGAHPVAPPPWVADLFPTFSAMATAPKAASTRRPVPRFHPADQGVRRTQIGSTEALQPAPIPDASVNGLQAALNESAGTGRPIGLEAALYGAITNNPDLVALRNNNIASPEAVEVARRFPTTLNPTVWIDYRPITLIPNDTSNGGTRNGPFYRSGQNYFLISVRQPIELGHQTTHRHAIARAALNQQEWTVIQAELLALVQTYRLFQTAAYRRDKLRVADDLADFNDRLLVSLKRRLEANQVAAADVVLAEVENKTTRQQVDVARQDYAVALADLRNQVGLPETAGTAEPLGEFILPRNIPPLNETELVQLALRSRPEIHAARAQARGALAAVNLARGDRIPTPVVGPQYVMNETGVQYVGLILVSPLPILNNGRPLVRQREADYRRSLSNVQQVEKRTVIQVRAAAAKWNAANRLVNQTAGLSDSLRTQVERMDRLFEANETDLTKLLQARQRLIQLENARLDALWQATQAQADLLSALGVPNLIAALNGPTPATTPTAAPTPRR